MNQTRIAELRWARGWTQERLAEASGVAVRTIQRLEAGSDASPETLSLIARALEVDVAELFEKVEREGFAATVQGLDERTAAQREARQQIEHAWRRLFGGLGIILSMAAAAFVAAGAVSGLVFFIPGGYWACVGVIGGFVQNVLLAPRLDRRYPLTAPGRSVRA